MEEKQEVYIETTKPSSWNLKNYFKSIKKFKWWVVGSTLVCALLGFGSFKFILNPMKSTISATFSYNLAATREGNDSYRFIDGTVFNFTDIISKENLVAIKNSDPEKFSSVDVDKLFRENTIKLEKVQDERREETLKEENVSFVISAKSKSFKNDDIGKDFLYAVLTYPKQISTKAIGNYSVINYLSNFVGTDAFEKQIAILKNQYNAVRDTYYGLTVEFGSSVIVDGSGAKLYELINLFNAEHSNGTLHDVDLLLDKMYSNYFLNYEEGKEAEKIDEIKSLTDSYIESVKTAEQELDLYKSRLADLISANVINIVDSDYVSKVLSYSQSIESYSKTVEQLKKQLKLYGMVEDEYGKFVPDTTAPINLINVLETKDTDWISKNNAFKLEIKAAYDTLAADSTNVTNAYKSLFSNYKNKIILHDYGYVVKNGSLSSFIGAGAGLVLGFVASSLIVTAIYIEKYEKSKEEK